MVLAGVLAALVAYRPWRRYMLHTPPPKRETADTQVMLAVAGAVIITIVGDSLARAFGLVGLGGVVRFRSDIADTRDAALMFLLIGVGMACGLGFVALAATIALLVAAVLLVFDYTDRTTRKTRVEMRFDEPSLALPALRAAFPYARLLSHPGDYLRNGNGKKHLNPESKTVVLELPGTAHHADAAHITDQLRQRGVTGIHHVRVRRNP
ncbi:MAG TPA: DUF4956 domain-containing protein [Chloroflexota bacterium]|nr:DUF4956 domain-containing protein [Chloroflexota bacterium]